MTQWSSCVQDSTTRICFMGKLCCNASLLVEVAATKRAILWRFRWFLTFRGTWMPHVFVLASTPVSVWKQLQCCCCFRPSVPFWERCVITGCFCACCWFYRVVVSRRDIRNFDTSWIRHLNPLCTVLNVFAFRLCCFGRLSRCCGCYWLCSFSSCTSVCDAANGNQRRKAAVRAFPGRSPSSPCWHGKFCHLSCWRGSNTHVYVLQPQIGIFRTFCFPRCCLRKSCRRRGGGCIPPPRRNPAHFPFYDFFIFHMFPSDFHIWTILFYFHLFGCFSHSAHQVFGVASLRGTGQCVVLQEIWIPKSQGHSVDWM